MSAYPFHTMDESPRRSPLLLLIAVVALVAGSMYFASHYQIEGLDHLSVRKKNSEAATNDDELDDFAFVGTSPGQNDSSASAPSAFAGRLASSPQNASVLPQKIRIGSWALSGFGPSKLSSELCRRNLVRMIRQFDVLALQQISGIERDLIPRLVDEVNEAGRQYDFVLGQPTGPKDNVEALAIVFNIRKVNIDRTQTYTVADPQNQMTYDPLVAWFRVAGPAPELAWTFSLVNTRINLSRAPAEVALLPGIFSSVRLDGRGEDDVVMAGLFQADDSYLIPRIMGDQIAAAVRSSTTDIFGRYQTCNLLVDEARTSEYLGRGGPVDFLRLQNLSFTEAESISSHLPVFAEFTTTEGGMD
jgi:hypothetical protein